MAAWHLVIAPKGDEARSLFGDSGRTMAKELLQKMGIHAAILSLLWLLLAGGEKDSWLIGLPTVILGVFVSLRLAPTSIIARLHWRAVPGFALLFLLDMVRGAFQTAQLALWHRERLKPGMVMVPLSAVETASRVLLINVVNLVPGTLSVKLVGDELTVHVLEASVSVINEVKRLEMRVAALFGERLA